MISEKRSSKKKSAASISTREYTHQRISKNRTKIYPTWKIFSQAQIGKMLGSIK
jgi:hypothetical protein